MHFGRRSEKRHGTSSSSNSSWKYSSRGAPNRCRAGREVAARKPHRRRLGRASRFPAICGAKFIPIFPKEQGCPECGGALRRLGEDVSEMLEYIPASFIVIRHVRPKLSCARCSCVVQAPAPARPVDRGLAGPGLLAHVLTAKYADHLPLYRQSQIYAR